MHSRVVIVSNRLPSVVSWENKKMVLKETAGGLVSGLRSWLDRGTPYIWIGWPGASVPAAREESVRSVLAEKHAAVPVFVPQAAMDRFYLGFCNRTIWPLFHYFPSYVALDADFWQKYRDVNATFLRTVQETLQPGDVVWIHDYHLMLLPGMIRRVMPEIPIGFFLHIPFPSFEIFRMLPSAWRTELLEGLLGADVVGFHTHEYCQYFLTSIRRMLGHDSRLGSITLADRVMRAETFPMGIDYRLFADLAVSPEVRGEVEGLRQSVSEMRTVLSIDRLDYSKGIAHRLHGFARFLELHPEWHGRVCLAMVVVPSRIGVDQYRSMKRQIDELVGDINGRFGSVGWTPIRYQYRMLSQVPLSALYTLSDVALVTPLRDGMNLIAKEYVASRTDRTGVLILSEMAGSARELGEALIVNPHNPDEIAAALEQALAMPQEEQVARNAAMQQRLRRHDVRWWADDFLQVLGAVHEERQRLARVSLTEPHRQPLLDAFARSSRRLLVLDYDGTLVPFAPHPDGAAPGGRLLEVLGRLAADPDTRLAIVSGRSRASLDRWFAGRKVDLAAEHGAWLRDPAGEWSSFLEVRDDWKAGVRPLLQSSADRLPGAFVEEKDFALVWHYRNCDPELGSHRAMELMDTLTALVAQMDVQVLRGNRVLEVRRAGIHKGTVVPRLLHSPPPDFVLAAGDDWTDEDLFAALPAGAWSIKVGGDPSLARYNLPDPDAVLVLLEELASRLPETSVTRRGSATGA